MEGLDGDVQLFGDSDDCGGYGGVPPGWKIKHGPLCGRIDRKDRRAESGVPRGPPGYPGVKDTFDLMWES